MQSFKSGTAGYEEGPVLGYRGTGIETVFVRLEAYTILEDLFKENKKCYKSLYRTVERAH